MIPMKCVVEQDTFRRGYKIYLFTDPHPTNGMRTQVVGFNEKGEPTLQDFENGSIVEPSLHMPQEWVKAMIEEFTGVLPASDATTEHLKDAMTIRDRLLVMVEHKMGVK